MKRPRLPAARGAAALILALLALAACTDMGAGSDPKETEGALLFALPPALKPSEIKAKGEEASPEDGESVEDAESASPPINAEETAAEGEAQELIEEPSVALDFPLEDAAQEESALADGLSEDDGAALPAETEPLEEGIAVLRYSLYMVSAAGFRQEEELAPSDEPAKVIAQAGRWKIKAVAEGESGEAVAACELSGVALSAGEEKAIFLEWEAP